MELPRGAAPAELAGGFGLPGAAPLSGRIEASFRRRLDALAADTRVLLLVAAADPVGDPVLVWRAAERLVIGTEAATPAVEAGLLEVDARVRFRHPLVRSAAYRSASSQERLDVHRALAEVTDPELDADGRAWHRAHATPGSDEDVAELERSAGRAQSRGGLVAAAAFLERAAMLTPEPARRAHRLLAAARAKRDAGAPDAALGLLVAVEAGPVPLAQGLHQARHPLVHPARPRPAQRPDHRPAAPAPPAGRRPGRRAARPRLATRTVHWPRRARRRANDTRRDALAERV